MTRPDLEHYVRATVERGAFTCEPAVEYRDGDDFDAVVVELRALADAIYESDDAMRAARAVGAAIGARWTDRAYFVEVWAGDDRGFAQVFQPFGVPRDAQFAVCLTDSRLRECRVCLKRQEHGPNGWWPPHTRCA